MKITKALVALTLTAAISAVSYALPENSEEILYFSDASATSVVGSATLGCRGETTMNHGYKTNYSQRIAMHTCRVKDIGGDIVTELP